jgi:hypothetical protein
MHAENAELRGLLSATNAFQSPLSADLASTSDPLHNLGFLPGPKGAYNNVWGVATVHGETSGGGKKGGRLRQEVTLEGGKAGAWVPRELLELGADLLRRVAPDASWADLGDFLLLVHRVRFGMWQTCFSTAAKVVWQNLMPSSKMAEIRYGQTVDQAYIG